MNKPNIKTVAIASGVVSLLSLAVGIANPTAIVQTRKQVTTQVMHTDTVAAPESNPIALSTQDNARNQFGAVTMSADHVYTGQPILISLYTSYPSARVTAPDASTQAVRPMLVQTSSTASDGQSEQMSTTLHPLGDAPVLMNAPGAGNIVAGYWQVSYKEPGVQTVTVNLGDGHVKTAEVTVVPPPSQYKAVHYQGVPPSTTLGLGVDQTVAQPGNRPWAFAVKIDTNYTNYSHAIPRVTGKWQVPWTIHSNETGQIVETLATPKAITETTRFPDFVFYPQDVAQADYTATYYTHLTISQQGTTSERFWAYWLGSRAPVVSWGLRPTIGPEWEWLALSTLLAGLSILGRLGRKNSNVSSTVKHGDKAAL